MTVSAVPAGVVAELVAAARGYGRMDPGSGSGAGGAAEASLLARLAETAIGLAERFCGCAVVRRPFEDVLPVSTAWQGLRAGPVTAIQGVTALPVGAAPFVLPVGAYAVDIDAGGDGWVRVTSADGADRVAVSYTAGLAASWDAVPAGLAQGCVALVAHLFEHRDGAAMPPAAVAALWRPFRQVRLLERVR